MDEKTVQYYNENAESLYNFYSSVASGQGISKYFLSAFPSLNAKILDIGAGSGRDILELLKHGYDAYGVDASESLVYTTLTHNPDLKGRLQVSSLPELKNLQGKYDSILCSAVLMHIPKRSLFDSACRIRELLNPNGRLLLSLPKKRTINTKTSNFHHISEIYQYIFIFFRNF